MKTLALALVLVMLFTGCSVHYIRPGATVEEQQTDFRECRQAAAGFSGGILTGLGVVIWPLLAVGIPLLVAAKDAEKSCMRDRGYAQESGQ
jgi:hypothetical protein